MATVETGALGRRGAQRNSLSGDNTRMTPLDLQALLDLRSEGEHVEFKEAKSNFHFDKLVGLLPSC